MRQHCVVPIVFIEFALGRSRFAAFIEKTTNPADLIGPEDKYAALKASVEMTPQLLGNYVQLFICTNSMRVQYGYCDCHNDYIYIAVIPIPN